MLQLQPFLSGTRRRHKPPSAATQWRLLLSSPSDPLDPALQRTPHRIVRHGSHDRGSFLDDEKALPSPCTNHTFELLGTWITFWYLLFIYFSVSILKLKKIKKKRVFTHFFNLYSFCLFVISPFCHFAFSVIAFRELPPTYSSASTDSATSIATESSSSWRTTCCVVG